jgi:hypothetical protein
MSTTRPPLKDRVIMGSMMLLGLILGFVVLAAKLTTLPEWACYVPVAAGTVAAVMYQQSIVKTVKEKAIP